LFIHRVRKSVSTQLQLERSLACGIRLKSISILITLLLLVTPSARSQQSGTPAENGAQLKQPVEREIVWVGLASYGNYSLFATEDMTKLYTSGVEYDRHSWGYFMRARMDYVAEFLPFVLLDEPADVNYFGDPGIPLSPNRKLVPGVGFSPIGLRMLWRDGKAIKPYVLLKGGMLVFDQKAISSHAAYANFSLQSGFGVQTPLTKRVDLRLGLWGDFHFSDGFVVPVNPGTDVMNANWGISYHLGPQQAKTGRRHRFPRL
jgi:hypothetical protein